MLCSIEIFFDQTVKNDTRTFENIQKITTDQEKMIIQMVSY